MDGFTFLRENNFEVIPHAPYSPDLAPRDFWLFPTMKDTLRGRTFTSRAAIASAIFQCSKQTPKEAFAAAMESWRRRCEKCVRLHCHGGHESDLVFKAAGESGAGTRSPGHTGRNFAMLWAGYPIGRKLNVHAQMSKTKGAPPANHAAPLVVSRALCMAMRAAVLGVLVGTKADDEAVGTEFVLFYLSST